MPNWIPLKEVLKSPDKYGDISKIPIDYTPDYSKITLIKEQTGVSNPQDFETEMDHTWYATLHKGMVYLVSGEVTKQDLSLCGKTGYENGDQIQRKIASLFENAILGTTGEIWTKDTIEMVTFTSPLSKTKYGHWTAIKYEKYGGFMGSRFGLHLAHDGYLYGGNNNSSGRLCSGDDYSYMVASYIRSLVHLPDNILMDTDQLDTGVTLSLMIQENLPVSSKGYIFIEEDLEQLESMAKWHREKADEISDLIKKIKRR